MIRPRRVLQVLLLQKPLHAFLRNSRSLQLHELTVFDPALVSRHISPQLSEPGYGVYDSFHRALLIRCAEGTILRVGAVS